MAEEIVMILVGTDPIETDVPFAVQLPASVDADKAGQRAITYFATHPETGEFVPDRPFLAFSASAWNMLSNAQKANLTWDPGSFPAPLVSENAGTNAAQITSMLGDVGLQTLPNDSAPGA
jgi:hypothetical protein